MTDLSHTHMPRPLPCPFCGVVPSEIKHTPHRVWCATEDCPSGESSHTITDWNRRAPVATPADVDAVRMCIVDAQQTLRGHLGEVLTYDQASVLRLLERQRSADQSLARVLNALASPAPTPPPSLAFWLGADA